MQEGSTKTITIEIIIGAIVLIVSTVVFLNVGTDLKVYLTIFLGAVGVLNFLALIQFWRKFGWKMARWQTRISKRPDLIDELHRLDGQINRVLYERRSDSPSLALQGAEVIEALAKAEDDTSVPSEFSEKLAMASTNYDQLHRTITNRYRGYKWDTLEFGEMLRSVSNHLTMVNKIFPTVYRASSSLTEKDIPFPKEVKTKWEDFRTDYNVVLHDWKKFIEQVAHGISYGVSIQADSVREIPEKS